MYGRLTETAGAAETHRGPDPRHFDMMEKDVPCNEILIQINAAKSALHKVGQMVVEGHLHHCVKDSIEHGNTEETLKDLSKVIEYFSRI